MKVVADTNVLVRAVVQDDPDQARMAARLLVDADLIAVALPCLCEFVWVLRKVYSLPTEDIAAAIRALAAAANVRVDKPAVEAGLAMLEANGDFADGVIAFEGRWLGGETFVSFDKKAVKQLTALGLPARLLSSRSPATADALIEVLESVEPGVRIERDQPAHQKRKDVRPKR